MKITNVTDVIVADNDTGEVKKTRKSVTYSIPSEPSYIKFYIEDIGALHGLTKGESDVLFSLAKLIGWDGIVSVSKTRFEKTIAPETGLKYQTFKNIVKKLVDKDIFLRAGRGELEANPFLFAKGEWQEVYQRRMEIEMRIKYSKDKKEISTKLTKSAG